ncbi:MAG: alpha/beta hydrolase [Anaerolineae bacterium]|nr:alpha/beta hydrolase [Anaerolineae bacterium]
MTNNNTPSIYKSPAGERAIMALYDNALVNWPVPHEERTIPTRHGDTFVIACGPESAPPLVLLHGAGTNSAIWAGDVAVYSQHFRVYAIDLLGEAGRSAPNRLDWYSSAYAEWLAEVLNVLQIAQAVLLGASLGGWTAIRFATMQPERVSQLVLLCPGGVVATRPSFMVKVIPLSFLGTWGARRISRMMSGNQPFSKEAEDILVQVMANFKPRIETLYIFTDEELARLTMPVLLIGGTKDVFFNMDRLAERLSTLLPALTMQIIPGAGHALLDTTGHVMAFLEATETTGPVLA